MDNTSVMTEEELEEYTCVCTESKPLTVEHLIQILETLDPSKEVYIYADSEELFGLTDIAQTDEKVLLHYFEAS